MNREEIINIRWLKNLFKDSSPSLRKISEKVGITAAFIEPATRSIKSISGMVKAAQKISSS
jgi:hypothetical protein